MQEICLANVLQIPVPPSAQMSLGPFTVLLDCRSVRWMIYVIENIVNAIVSSENGASMLWNIQDVDASSIDVPYTATRFDLVMPKVRTDD